jgi:hypothetical protein
MRKLALSAVVVALSMAALVLVAAPTGSATRSANPVISFLIRSLDGSGNNLAHVDWGRAGTQYLRLAKPNYADNVAKPISGPSPRYISNRIFNDVGQNIFSENDVSQWGWAWGQFVDHDIGLRDETPAEDMPIPFDAHDPLEQFTNDLGAIAFARTPAAPGTGTTSPRQQINTLSSYIDGSQVYGVTNARLDWLRDGTVDGNPANNVATLMLPGGYLPRANARGNAAPAPPVDLMGGLVATPEKAAVAGDVRANENIALTGLQTLFAREHNRIVAALPSVLTQEEKFQVARRVVGAEVQFVTYDEFLPTLGVKLDAYRGYNPGVDAGLSNEFATVGFRGHSMIHGELEPTVAEGTYPADELAAFTAAGMTVEHNGDGTLTLVIPLDLAFGNPDLLQQVGLGPVLQSLDEHEYKNDEQIDNALRSVLFQVPKPGIPDPTVCGEPVVNPSCFADVQDLGAIDVQRGRDHGMPSYNDLRQAYGLAPARSFTDVTGETTDRFPRDPSIDSRDPIDDPSILDFVELRDVGGNPIPLGGDAAQEDAVAGVRRTTLAARLKAIYGDVGKLDAFVGLASERHVPGTEFGPLELAIWKKQFESLRDGDRFFYLNDPALVAIERLFRISYRHTLAEIVKLNTGTTVPPNVFRAA